MRQLILMRGSIGSGKSTQLTNILEIRKEYGLLLK